MRKGKRRGWTRVYCDHNVIYVHEPTQTQQLQCDERKINAEQKKYLDGFSGISGSMRRMIWYSFV